MKKNIIFTLLIVIISCLIMSFVELVIEPVYYVKSIIKIILFFIIPLIIIKKSEIIKLEKFPKINKKDFIKLFFLGMIILFNIVLLYYLTRNIFDYRNLVKSLSTDQGVNPNSFILVSIYICFFNSFLEEFLFRYICFINMLNYTSKIKSFVISSVLFSVYHISMISCSFPLPLMIISLIGLFIGGCIFNYLDSKSSSIYNSWVVHMFADIALMIIWYINI